MLPDKNGVDRAEMLALADRHLLGNYRPARLVMVKGEGCRLFDDQGTSYLDFCAGVAVCGLGHAHPDLVEAIAAQAATVMQVSNYFYTDQNIALAAELSGITGYDRVFFCNSGAEANEALIKVARRHFYESGQPERVRLLAFDGAFHGRTLGALALTGTPKYRLGFGEGLAGVTHVAYGDLDAVKAAWGDDLAAVVVEPVMGEGGVLPAPPGFLAGLRALCDESGALLLLDEVQTGAGRTGTFLASEHDGVEGDAVALAKGLGGGFPIGAVLLREALAGSLPPGAHGSTFGGNPLACAAARSVLSVLKRDHLVERAATAGKRYGEQLQALASRHPSICRGERGRGLMRALILVDGIAPRDLLIHVRTHGLLVTAAGPDALRMLPPLVVSDAELDESIAILDRAFSTFSPGDS